MLNLYESFHVPGIPHVKVYRDDERPHKFYMVSERAGIARDGSGNPLFTFMLYARDVDRLPEDQLDIANGYLAVTAQAGVSRETEEEIRAYLREMLQKEHRAGRLYLWRPVRYTEPELGYPDLWLDGSVRFRALGPDMVPHEAGSTQPSLIGANTASFSATLSQDGAELFRQALEEELVPAGVWYELTFAARIPAVQIRIRGDRGAFYREVRDYVRRRRETVHRYRFLGWTHEITRREEWSELASITEFSRTFHHLTIEVDDSTLPGVDDEMRTRLLNMAFGIVQDNVLPGFFEAALREVAGEEEGDPGDGVPVHTVDTGTLDITINQSTVVEQKVNPSVIFSQALSAEELRARTSYLNLDRPYFQELDVHINANVNFDDDPVYGLKVFLEYDHTDEARGERIRRVREFLFRSAEEVARFRVIMARDADGVPRDSYRYWSEISYEDTGETIRVPRTGSTEADDRQLVISYSRLGFIRVNVLLGTMPESVRAVHVRMRYPDYSAPSAEQSFELSREHPAATFFTYTGKPGEPQSYHYQISYLLADGGRMDLPEQTTRGETLTIRDPFERTATVRFLGQADFAMVEKIIVDAVYEDAANGLQSTHHAEIAENGEVSAWTLGLRDPGHSEFTYTVTIINRNGSRVEQGRQRAELGGTIPVGPGAVDVLEVTVIGSTADWSRYQLVVVYLKYDDADNDIYETQSLTFRSAADPDESWKVLLRDRKRRSYSYRLRFIGADPGDNRETAWTGTDDTVLIIQ